MNIGDRIVHANGSKGGVLSVEQAAGIIFAALFETGPNRLSAHQKHVAMSAIIAGLTEWKKQLAGGQAAEVEKWTKLYNDTKAQLDDVMLKYAILKKEQ